MIPFKEALGERIILADGAMGTAIYTRGTFIDKCYDAINLSNADIILDIHKSYLAVGSQLIETNTFGANPLKLNKFNLGDKMEDINRQGVAIAREAAGDDAWVAGAMGPTGISMEPYGELSLETVCRSFLSQAAVLHDAGVDCFYLETFQDLAELEQAVCAVRRVSDRPVVAHMSIQADGRSVFGVELPEIVKRLTERQVDALGINCVVGPKDALEFVEILSGLTDLPVSVMPNAGIPQMVDGRTFYMTTPEYFGVYAKRFIDAGATLIGGCCGTMPEHIQRMAGAFAMKTTRSSHKINLQPSSVMDKNLPKPVPMEEKSGLACRIYNNEPAVLVEMVSPRGRIAEKQIAGARMLKEAGIDAINIPDGPRASARMNALALSVLLEHRGIETVLHYTCRDRNLLGIQSDLIGAAALGIKNVLAITGDPPMMGDYPQATPVFDIDAIGLTNVLAGLNRGFDIGQKLIGEPTGFLIGVGVDPNAVNLQKERDRFKWKVDAGAEYAITQPVFDVDSLSRFVESLGDVTLPLIAGIWPLVSLRNAEFMRNEVPGVTVPDSIFKQMARFDTREDQLKVGIDIAKQMVEKVISWTAGIQVSAPFGRYTLALEVAEAVLASR
ncbi:bifunctional homocysteine S-methyltransferase/methylenetetrahydrofolate reductase [bacterium]|nr:bifunctional homocysteine S-methyltransferase/methylenetetrahydrofolate reductase [bacterium]